jgi:murein DD-endopeptidase MepM/ murein hydrolase activator NlpD
MKPLYIIIIVIVVVAGALYAVYRYFKGKKNSIVPPIRTMKMRHDSAGHGTYGASRSGHAHNGIDVIVTPGETVYAPVTGTILRKAYPYKNYSKLEGFILKADNGDEWKFFYCQTTKVGQRVTAGTPIATMQDVRIKYPHSPTMQPHLHFELKKNGVQTDPTALFF